MSVPRFFLCLSLLLLTACTQKEIREETASIKEKAKAYEEAYNKKDAKALSLLWAEDAEYVDPDSDEPIKGRDAIEKQFAEVFENEKNTQMIIKVDSIKFPKNDQAVEIGTAILNKDGKEVDRTAYKAFYIKKDGNWLLKEVREEEAGEAPLQSERLKELEWLVGEWVDEDKDAEIVNTFSFDKYKNFLIQQFTVSVEGTFEIEGKQLIAYDPIKDEIRSWIFDSDGGFGEGVWKKKGNSWVVEMAQTLADGKRASSTNVYTPINENRYSWKSVGREIDGELLPDVGPVTIVRRKV